MTRVKGHYNGSVVVLDEPAPAPESAEVTVQFPDSEADKAELASEDTRYYWNNARDVYLRFAGTVSDEVLRQRGRFDVAPSGLPSDMPSDEEWKERAARISRMLRQWQAEEPSEDLATREELKKALNSHP